MQKLRFSWMAFAGSLLAMAMALQALMIALLVWFDRSNGRSLYDRIQNVSCFGQLRDEDSLTACVAYFSIAMILALLPFAAIGILLVRWLTNSFRAPPLLGWAVAFTVSGLFFATTIAHFRASAVDIGFLALTVVLLAIPTAAQGVVYHWLIGGEQAPPTGDAGGSRGVLVAGH